MTIELLNQYRSLQREIKYLEKKLRSMEDSALHDSVLSSNSGPDYALHEISVYGSTAKKRKYEKMYKRRKVSAERHRDSIESFIDSAEDSMMRQILTLRFIEGKSWQRVADEVGGNNTENSVKKRCHRYIKRCPTCPEIIC